MLSFLAPILTAIIRHTLTCIAGVLVAKGILSGDQIQPFVGSAMFMVGLIWSLWHKVNTPEMLAHLVARASARTALAKKVFVGATVAMAAGAAVTASAQAQNFIFAPPPKPASIVHKVQAKPRALLNLPSLIPSQPTQVDVFAQLQQASITDLQYAEALADAASCSTSYPQYCPQGVTPPPPTAATTAAQNAAQCYAAIAAVLATTSSVQASVSAIGASATPAPNAPAGIATAFTKFEQLRQVSMQLQPMSPVQTACAPLGQAIRMSVGQMVLGILGGGLSLAKFGVIP